MTLLVALLRLVHIVSGVAWVGLGLMMATFVLPATVTAAGESGLRFMKTFFTHTRFGIAFPVASGLTILVGILLYITGDVGRNFASTGQIVLGIGALVGLAAGVHGGAITGRETTAYAKSLAQYGDDQPIPAEGLATLRAQATKLGADARISLALTVIALIAMGSARYL